MAACFAIIFIGGYFLNTIHISNNNQITHDANSIVEVDTLKEAENITGFSFKYSIDKEKYNKEFITIYDKNMIYISFKAEDYSEGYYIRKSLKEEDINGDFSDYRVVEIHIINGHNVTLKGDGKLWSVATWNTNRYAYALGCQSHPMSMEELTEKIKAIK